MNKMFRILEIIWLLIAITGIGLCLYSMLILKDKNQAIYLLVFTVISGLMYARRKRQRIKMGTTPNSGKAPEEKNNPS